MRCTDAADFKTCFHDWLSREALAFPTLTVARHQHVYMCGDRAESLYFIGSGQIKLSRISSDGKEGVVAIYTAGDTFGEDCLTASDLRQETATAMSDTVLRRIPGDKFFARVSSHNLIEGFVSYLANRVANRQEWIANLLTLDSECRLGKTLLLLARKLGRRDHRYTAIELKITHEELSAMVGTTRARITQFMMKFRDLGLISVTGDRYLLVSEDRLMDYLARFG